MGNGKKTENWAVQQLERCYGTDVDIIRLLDKFDTGRFQDVRPSDFILIFSEDVRRESFKDGTNTVYFESKESESKILTFNFSTLRQGQTQAMVRSLRLKVNYFVLYRNLTLDLAFLIPAKVIVALKEKGVKSMNSVALSPFEWDGKLYSVF